MRACFSINQSLSYYNIIMHSFVSRPSLEINPISANLKKKRRSCSTYVGISKDQLAPAVIEAAADLQSEVRGARCESAVHKQPHQNTLTMSIPAPLATGTFLYLIIGAALLGLVFASRLTGRLSKDNAEIANVVVIISTIATWLFWLCAWMHQWHPLIKPIYEE